MQPMRASTSLSLVLLAVSVPLSAGAVSLAPVELAVAQRAPLLEELNLTGSLTAPRSAELGPAVAGRIQRIEVDTGDRVTEGEVLAALDDELARLELSQAHAAEREAAAQLADVERRLEEARALAKRQSFAETEVRSRESEVARSRAVLERLRAVSAYDRALLERHTLKAPFDGVVARRDADLGEWVDPDNPVFELVAVDRLRLDLQVPQGYYGRVDADTGLSVTLDALPGERFDAAVSTVVPISDPAARTFLVRARLDNRQGRMTPGMSGRATVRIGTGRQGIVVPRDALIRYPDGRTVVWIATGEGERRRVQERRIRTGLATARSVEVREGLEAGTEVVVRGNESLRQNQEVRVSAAR